MFFLFFVCYYQKNRKSIVDFSCSRQNKEQKKEKQEKRQAKHKQDSSSEGIIVIPSNSKTPNTDEKAL